MDRMSARRDSSVDVLGKLGGYGSETSMKNIVGESGAENRVPGGIALGKCGGDMWGSR